MYFVIKCFLYCNVKWFKNLVCPTNWVLRISLSFARFRETARFNPSTQPALELTSKHMTKQKSVNIICEISFTNVFMKYSLWPKRFCLQVFDTKKNYIVLPKLVWNLFKNFSLRIKNFTMCIFKKKQLPTQVFVVKNSLKTNSLVCFETN